MEEKITWNPVKNGYPEKHRGFYLVTARRIDTSDAFVTIAEWKKLDDEQGYFYLYFSSKKITEMNCVVEAWAELPEPWREKEDGR